MQLYSTNTPSGRNSGWGILFLVLLNSSFYISYSQNLIMNPSFEEFEQVKKKIQNPFTGRVELKKSEYKNPLYWRGCSADYFHPDNPKDRKSPSNDFGKQLPHTGNCYMGLVLYNSEKIMAREYLCGKLLTPLKKDSVYRLSFYLSLAEDCTLATSNIGVFISEDSLRCLDYFWDQVKVLSLTFNYYPQVQNDTSRILKDKNNWMKIEGNYTAKGNEQYIIIGNFDFDSTYIDEKVYDSSSYFPWATTINDIPSLEKPKSKNPIYLEKVQATLGFPTGISAYYYIDDITLEEINSSFPIRKN